MSISPTSFCFGSIISEKLFSWARTGIMNNTCDSCEKKLSNCTLGLFLATVVIFVLSSNVIYYTFYAFGMQPFNREAIRVAPQIPAAAAAAGQPAPGAVQLPAAVAPQNHAVNWVKFAKKKEDCQSTAASHGRINPGINAPSITLCSRINYRSAVLVRCRSITTVHSPDWDSAN